MNSAFIYYHLANQLIGIDSKSDESDADLDYLPQPPRSQSTTRPSSAQPSAATVSRSMHSTPTPVSTPTPARCTTHVQRSQSSSSSASQTFHMSRFSSQVAMPRPVQGTKPAHTTTVPALLSFRETELPHIMRQGGWRMQFLPTLYAYMGSSCLPWNVISPVNSTEAIKELQQITDACFPGSNYKVKWGDVICETVSTTTSHLYAAP